MSHDTFSRHTRNHLKQVFDALRELMTTAPSSSAADAPGVLNHSRPSARNTNPPQTPCFGVLLWVADKTFLS
jgi:hypothetical protein